MIENPVHRKSNLQFPVFSILIPSWNNLEYLKLCIKSIQKNSFYKHQVIVYINEGKDQTAAYLDTLEGVDYIHSEKNDGICYALNSCRRLVKAAYIVYMNDDMYVCPNWDVPLVEEINRIPDDLFSLSATLIEPTLTHNPQLVSIVADFGTDLESFREEQLLKDYSSFTKDDWSGASWPPNVFSLSTWDKVGGYSIEFSPGMYSDPDFSMKLWKSGVRHFKGIGSSRVYHFGSKSTKRIRKNKGSDLFLAKWGITARTFYRYYLKMGRPAHCPLTDPPEIPFWEVKRNMLKKILRGFK